jgi:NAD(P)-dependent dehydrogenase (short-subunit alcohol dehydrogenase family)
MADVILFGASGGIGQYLVDHVGSEHRVIGTYNHSDPGKLASHATYRQVDVTHSEAVGQFIGEFAPSLKQPVLIYTPGISPNATAHKVTDEDWDRTLAVNLTGAMYAARAVLPVMRERQWGRIILVSSVLSRQGVPGTLAYSATKAALSAMVRVISVENATKGVTANALALGYFSVGIIAAVPEAFLKEHVLPGIPQHRLGSPANIASAVRFIIEADYLTGATLDINGGIFGA